MTRCWRSTRTERGSGRGRENNNNNPIPSKTPLSGTHTPPPTSPLPMTPTRLLMATALPQTPLSLCHKANPNFTAPVFHDQAAVTELVPPQTLLWSMSHHTTPKVRLIGYPDPQVTRERMKSGRKTLKNWTVTIQVITLGRQLTVRLVVDCSGEAVTPLTGGGTEFDVPSPQ